MLYLQIRKKGLKIRRYLYPVPSAVNVMLKGPFIFYEVGGAGGIWGWVTEKRTALKGGSSKKNKGNGGVT